MEVSLKAFQIILLVGYSDLIRTYSRFLIVKLDYHALHPEFNGNFDYDEYVSLKGVAEPNEGYSISLLSTLV
jgi:hypothetical protein